MLPLYLVKCRSDASDRSCIACRKKRMCSKNTIVLLNDKLNSRQAILQELSKSDLIFVDTVQVIFTTSQSCYLPYFAETQHVIYICKGVSSTCRVPLRPVIGRREEEVA